MIKNKVAGFLFLLLLAPVAVSGADFFTTSGFKFVQRRGSVSYAAEVDFPVTGAAAALRSVKSWICDILEVEEPARLEKGDFQALLQRSLEGFLGVADICSRRIEIERRYEDADVVTFAALVVDKDSATWRSEDYATFSKVDGHRIQVDVAWQRAGGCVVGRRFGGGRRGFSRWLGGGHRSGPRLHRGRIPHTLPGCGALPAGQAGRKIFRAIVVFVFCRLTFLFLRSPLANLRK